MVYKPLMARFRLAPALSLVGILWATRADAVETARCYDAHEQAQIERKTGAWTKARKLLAVCGSEQCPAIVQRDCVTWQSELAARQPSVIVAVVRDDNTDVLGAHVTLDGTQLDGQGRATEVDPGEHVVKIEIPGEPTIERRVALREGERGRRVTIRVAAPRASTRPPVISWVLGGVAVASLGTFAAFAISGKSDEHELARTCGDRCSDAQVDDVSRSYLIADIALGVAILTAGAAVATWLFVPKKRVAASASF
jgi:hypothetical protein